MMWDVVRKSDCIVPLAFSGFLRPYVSKSSGIQL